MQQINRRDLVLMLVGLAKDGRTADEVGGITRLQKFLFLLEKEEDLQPTGRGFEFTPYKAGPYSSQLYDDLEFLENLGLLKGEIAAEATEAEAAELDHELDDLTFDDLMGDNGNSRAPDMYEERRFRLTEKGANRVGELLATGKFRPVVDRVRRIKSKFGAYSLQDLLYYVYTKYPEMTVESKIKEHVLRRRR